ncbi:hypothetical protein [Archangium sp.]|jgi:hypothetical protein|uniref:hypothetical protein n=1 Tax=Archangium sp. TaxID=1872627 RepID=UPI002ED8E531
MHGARAGRGRPQGFTLLAVLVVLAALTLVVGMALQRGEDERRNAYLVQHDALALSAAEFGLDRTRAYVGAVLDNEVDLDKVLDPKLNTDCVALPLSDGGTLDDNLFPAPDDAGSGVPFSGRKFRLFPYRPGADGGMEGAYLVRIDDNDDDGISAPFGPSTNNNRKGVFNCEEGPTLPTKSNLVRDRDRTVIATVVGIAPGMDVTRAQARKVLRARLGSAPAAGIVAGGTIELDGTSHVCGTYGNVSVNSGDFADGCVCGAGCGNGPPYQTCGTGNACNVQVSGSTCNVDFGGAAGSCTTNVNIPPPPKVEVWSKLNAPPACPVGSLSCIPFFYLREVSGKAEVYMWKYAASGCDNPQAFARIHYPGEASSPAAACWKLVYGGTGSTCPTGTVQMADDASLRARDPSMTTACGSAPVVWGAATGVASSRANCDASTTLYPGVGAVQYRRDYVSGSVFTFQASSALTPIPHGVWFVEGSVTFKGDMPDFNLVPPNQGTVSLVATGNVVVDGNATVRLRPANRDVVVMAGRDLTLVGGNSFLFTCGDPATVPTNCPSVAVMVHEQFKMGNNSHLQAQLVVQDAATCSGATTKGRAIEMQGNGTISVPGVPPISSSSGAAVLSWGEGSL